MKRETIRREAEKRAQQMIALKLAGWPYREIGAKFGICKQRARAIILEEAVRAGLVPRRYCERGRVRLKPMLEQLRARELDSDAALSSPRL